MLFLRWWTQAQMIVAFRQIGIVDGADILGIVPMLVPATEKIAVRDVAGSGILQGGEIEGKDGLI